MHDSDFRPKMWLLQEAPYAKWTSAAKKKVEWAPRSIAYLSITVQHFSQHLNKLTSALYQPACINSISLRRLTLFPKQIRLLRGHIAIYSWAGERFQIRCWLLNCCSFLTLNSSIESRDGAEPSRTWWSFQWTLTFQSVRHFLSGINPHSLFPLVNHLVRKRENSDR